MIDIRTADLLDFVPESIRSDPEIAALTAAITPELQAVAVAVDEAIIWPNIDEQPEDVLDAMAWQLRLAELGLWDSATLAGKRKALHQILDVRRRSGTVYAVRHILRLLEVDAEIVEWWQEGAPTWGFRVVADVSEAGITAEQVLNMPELIRRFARTAAHLTRIDLVSRTSGALKLSTAVTIGRLVTIGP